MNERSKKYQLDLADDIVKELLPVIFKELIEDYENFQFALKQKNLIELKRNNHKLRGVSRNFHFPELLEVCLHLDKQINQEESVSEFKKIEDLSKELKKAILASISMAAESYDYDIDLNNINL